MIGLLIAITFVFALFSFHKTLVFDISDNNVPEHKACGSMEEKEDQKGGEMYLMPLCHM